MACFAKLELMVVARKRPLSGSIAVGFVSGRSESDTGHQLVSFSIMSEAGLGQRGERKFRLEQQGLDHRALVGVIGGRSRVYEIMHRKRGLSLEMIRRLNQRFGIPAEVLIRPIRTPRQRGAAFTGSFSERAREFVFAAALLPR